MTAQGQCDFPSCSGWDIWLHSAQQILSDGLCLHLKVKNVKKLEALKVGCLDTKMHCQRRTHWETLVTKVGKIMSDLLFYGCSSTVFIYDFSRWQIFLAYSVQHVYAYAAYTCMHTCICIYMQQLFFSLITSLIFQASHFVSRHSTDSPNVLLLFPEVLLIVHTAQRNLTEFCHHHL